MIPISQSKPVGFTILEIMLALLILGGAMAALGQLSRNALRHARDSKEMTQAEFLAESILAKVRLEIIERESAYQVPITNLSSLTDMVVDTNAVSSTGGGEPLWIYDLDVTDIDDYGLQEIAVTVRQNLPEESRPLACRLVRWFAVEPEEDEESTETGTSGTGSTSTSTSSTASR